MPTIRYHASEFEGENPFLVGTHDLEVSWEEINWAAQTVGKAEQHVGIHGLYSLFEACYRVTMIWANLMESATGRLIRSPAYDALDPSEKGSVSYYLGLVVAKLFAFHRLDTPWLLHFDIYGDEHDAQLQGEEKPDLIGLNADDDWVVYEAKGRTGGFLAAVLADAKEQSEEITTIGGLDPVLRIGSLVYFRSDGMHLSVVDPSSRKRRRPRDIKLSAQEFLDRYYSPLNATLEARPDARREVRDGEEYRMLELNDLDVTIGIPARRPLRPLAGEQGLVNAPRFVGPDGVEITLGNAWSHNNMRRDPRLRTR